MISLPSSLAPWSSQLATFPNEIALALGPLVQRLAAAIDPLRVEDIPGQDDPDGFDGLVNRGSYERLIASDWLLAEEIPEEFERRASMSEHLFLKTAKLDRAHGLGSMVLFDAGPDQIGSPRLAHLAVLIVLMRRAQKANANFSWGILQEPERPILHGSSESEVLTLLRARTFMLVTQAKLHELVQRALAANRAEEVWLVGGTTLHQLSPHHLLSRIHVEDVFELTERRVSVDIYRAKGRPRKILLSLPAENACAQLLRDPYQARAGAAAAIAVHGDLSPLIFAPGSGQVLTLSGGKTLLSFIVPNRPMGESPRLKRHVVAEAGPIVAVNRVGRSTAVITLEDDSLRLSYIGRETSLPSGKYKLQNAFEWPSEDNGELLLPCVRPAAAKGRTPSLLVLDAAGTLFRLTSKGNEYAAKAENRRVLALANRAQAFRSWGLFDFSDGSTELAPLIASQAVTGEDPTRAVFGFGADYKLGQSLCAIQTGSQRWQIVRSKSQSAEVITQPGVEVVGVLQQSSHAEALVTLKEERHIVALQGSNWERKLFESADPIIHLTVSQDQPWLAYATSAGDVTVYALNSLKVLCRYVNRREA